MGQGLNLLLRFLTSQPTWKNLTQNSGKKLSLCMLSSLLSTEQPELAETFYNSVFCRLFSRSFYNTQYIFTKPSVSLNYIDMDEPVTDSYFIEKDQLKNSFTSILNSYFKKSFIWQS